MGGRSLTMELRQRNGDAECDGFLRTMLCSRITAREIHVW
jgi:hypothetical protein